MRFNTKSWVRGIFVKLLLTKRPPHPPEFVERPDCPLPQGERAQQCAPVTRSPYGAKRNTGRLFNAARSTRISLRSSGLLLPVAYAERPQAERVELDEALRVLLVV